MTFSEKPQIQSLIGTTLKQRVNNLSKAHWTMNTNIEAAFEAILKAAKAVKMDPTEMIRRIYIVSDMEFDTASQWRANGTLFQHIRNKYAEAGYNMPELVFWNVASRNSQYPMAMDERGFLNVSGCSPSIFKFTLGKEFLSAYDIMLSVLNSERYGHISVSQ